MHTQSTVFLAMAVACLSLVSGFVLQHPLSQPTRLFSFSEYNPNDQESPEERQKRMDLVRQIQATFYQESNDDDDSTTNWLQVDDNNPTIIQELPLWRVQWTEFPGYQNVLNVHVPHYTHMFRQLVLQHPPPWYFGHVYLYEGSKNLGNPAYNLPERFENGTISEVDEAYSPLIGTLMQISDYVVQDDGRLTMIVQGVGRIRILEATQQVPYAVARVERLPDDECWQQYTEPLVGKESAGNESEDLRVAVVGAAKAVAVQQEESMRELDYRTTVLDRKDTVFEVSPLSNVNGTMSMDFQDLRYQLQNTFSTQLEAKASELGSDEVLFASSTLPMPDMSIMDADVADLEKDVWIQMDKMIRLLVKLQPGLQVPVPAQLLGLLPTNVKWPSEFQLEKYAEKLEAEDVAIGTYSKSPFVRLSRQYPQYPVLKRAGRFSYVVWMILNTVSFDNQGSSKEEVLRTTSVRERLRQAEHQLRRLNEALRTAT